MKLFYLGLAIYSFTPWLEAKAQAPKSPTDMSIVQLIGNVDPVYTVTIDENDLKRIADGLNGIQSMENITVDRKESYSSKDSAAFNLASQEVSRVMLESAKSLVDMRAIVYKLNIAIQLDTKQTHTAQIYSSYQRHFQNRFTNLLELFLTKDGHYNEVLTSAMEHCFTEACMQDISDAQSDLVEFGRSINHRIDLNSSTTWKIDHQAFRSRIVKDTVQRTWDKVLNTNQVESLYVKLLRVAAAPFVTAASGIGASSEALGDFIIPRTASRFKVMGEPLQRTRGQWATAQAAFDKRFGENYDRIVSTQNGASQYHDEGSDSGNEKPLADSNSISAPAELRAKLATIQSRINALTKLQATAVSLDTAKSMISSMLVDVKDGTNLFWAFHDHDARFALAKASGIEVGPSSIDSTIPETNLHVRLRPSYFYRPDGSYQDFVYQKSLRFGAFFIGETVVWLMPFHSEAANRNYIYWSIQDVNDYFHADKSGNFTINQNPRAPKTYFIPVER